MSGRAAVLCVIAAASLHGAYTWDYQQSPVATDAARWKVNGYVNFQSFGASFPAYASDSGSMISLQAASGANPNDYEVQSTLAIVSGNGSANSNYIHFLRASANTVVWGVGSYVSAEVVIPATFTSPGAATLIVNQCVNGVITQIGSAPITARNGMVFRTVIFGTNLWVFLDNTQVWTQTVPLTAGLPGIGGTRVSGANGFSGVKIGPRDTVAALAPGSTGLDYYSTPGQISLRARAVIDDINGIGTWSYTLSRSDMTSPVALSEIPEFVDNTVQPSTTYTYSLTATDFHGNTTPPRVFSVTTPSSSAVDPRRVGAYPTGSYWGAGGERIDMLSGNLNFTIPLLAAQGRTGWAVPLNLLYNSQMWRNESGRVWSLEHASGISWGWRIEFGSLIPYYAEWWAAPDHFVFTDGNGAQYRLDVNSNGIWSSSRNARVWFDASANLLHFADGASWTMGTLSTGPNDAGTMYPTVMEDSNGNKIMVSYLPGIPPVRNVGNQISTIEDVRGKGSPSYLFTYTTDGILSSIASQVGTTENWTFGFGSSIPINDPFGSMSWGTNSFLTTVTGATGTSWSLTHDPSGSGELTKVTFPDGGYVRWVYETATYSGGRQIREVTSRYVSNGPGTTEWGPYTFTHDDSANPSPTIHANTTLTDASGVGAKTWKFILPDGNAAHAWQVGLPSEFLQKASASGAVLTHDTNTWTQDADGNPYVSQKLSAMDEGQTWAKSSKVTQTLDRYGNVTQQQIFDYGNLTTPVRTYTNTWLHSWSTPHANAYIRNRLYSSTLTDNAAHTVTLVANTYDGGTLAAVSGGTPMEFDTVRGASTNHVRGNVTQTVSMGATMNYTYDVTGQALTGMDMTGSGQSASYASATNFAAPSTVAPMAGTADVMNGHTATQAAGSSLTSSMGTLRRWL